MVLIFSYQHVNHMISKKTHKEQFIIVGGVFDGVYKTKEEMMSIATIPGLQTLRGMFVNLYQFSNSTFCCGTRSDRQEERIIGLVGSI